jgi:predicted RND superfamily exporter protein
MAKTTKKTVTRPTNAAAKYSRSSLVRVTPVAEAQEDAVESFASTITEIENSPKKSVVVPPSTAKRVTPALNVPTKAAAKSAVAAQAAAAQAAQAVRRGKASVRNANPGGGRPAIRAENYGYVVRDLRFIAVLAVLVVIIMVVLRIVIKR